MKESFERKLASIQLVEAVSPHPNADRLDIVTVLGWQVVEVRDKVRAGDHVVYFEIDSLIPLDAPWVPLPVKERAIKDHMKKDAVYHEHTFRIKTIKLRGELSQGLIVPLENFSEIGDFISMDGLPVGYNLTEFLKIQKYDPPEIEICSGARGDVMRGEKENAFPVHLVSKTNEPRIQSCPELLKKLAGQCYYVSVKLDGTSATYLVNPETRNFLICSRNLILPPAENKAVNDGKNSGSSESVYHEMAKRYNIHEILASVLDDSIGPLAIQGEICGPKIQKNLLNLSDVDFFVFNVVQLGPAGRRKLPFSEMVDFCQRHGLKTVPIEYVSNDSDNLLMTIPECLNMARGFYPDTKNFREGLVFRTLDQSLSFKAINNDYLLKQK